MTDRTQAFLRHWHELVTMKAESIRAFERGDLEAAERALENVELIVNRLHDVIEARRNDVARELIG